MNKVQMKWKGIHRGGTVHLHNTGAELTVTPGKNGEKA
jgi:hypothetical protein